MSFGAEAAATALDLVAEATVDAAEDSLVADATVEAADEASGLVWLSVDPPPTPTHRGEASGWVGAGGAGGRGLRRMSPILFKHCRIQLRKPVLMLRTHTQGTPDEGAAGQSRMRCQTILRDQS